jgi:ferric-dicitrate binding protein FerR (iron transport regulator)
MTLQEAREFVAHFVRGGFAPEEYAAFQQFLEGATEKELTIIADTHEAMHGEWMRSAHVSTEWIMQLEQKLDVSDGRVLDENDEEMEEETVMGDRGLVVAEEELGDERIAPVVRMRPGKLTRRSIWIAAASVVILFSTGTYIYVHEHRGSNDIRSGERLVAQVVSNPRGAAIKEMTLGDGSKVWLKPGSELKYPSQFVGSERMVALSGEAFFEVAGSSGSPFRVLIKDAEVDVLGTYFAVMAYDDEPVRRATLLDGAVNVKSGANVMILKPGEQADIDYPSPGVGGQIHLHSIDPKRVLDWKNGIYHLGGASFSEVMRVLMRSYDITVKYQPNMESIPPVDGMLNVNWTLEAALKHLKGAYLDKVNFKQIGKTVIVTSI